MTQTFVPLLPGVMRVAEPATPTRLRPISSAAPKFEATQMPSAEMPTEPHGGHGEPKVTLERQGETITHIRIECSCGKILELKCEY